MSDYYSDTWEQIAAALDAGHGLRVTLGDGMSAYVPADELEAECDYLNPGETFDVTPCTLCEAGESQIHNYDGAPSEPETHRCLSEWHYGTLGPLFHVDPDGHGAYRSGWEPGA